jgi:ABC-type lipoprotein release transport system permease subunit
MQLLDIILIISTVFCITLLAAYFPAKRAANQSLELKS